MDDKKFKAKVAKTLADVHYYCLMSEEYQTACPFLNDIAWKLGISDEYTDRFYELNRKDLRKEV